MMLVRMRTYNTIETEILPKGHHFVDISLDELVFFIRKGKAIPIGDSAENTSKLDASWIKLIGYDNATYELYDDDGYSTACNLNENIRVIGK